MAKDVQSFDRWQATNPAKRPMVWVETLPVEIQEQIRDADASAARIVAWLHDIGYTEATSNKVDRWRREERAKLKREQRSG